MRVLLFTGIAILYSVSVLSQDLSKDSTFNLTDYYLKNIEERPYKLELLDSVVDTKVALIPPDHFIFSEKIPGYIHPGTSSSIQVKEIEGTSWTVIDKVMTKEHFEKQGVKYIGREEVTLFSGLTGVIHTVEFEAEGVKFERKILFAGDYNHTIWLNANYPASMKQIVIKPLIKSLLSANIIAE